MKKIAYLLLFFAFLGKNTAQSPLFHAYGNIEAIAAVPNVTGQYDLTINSYVGGYKQFTTQQYAKNQVQTGYVIWGKCTRYVITQVVNSVFPFILRVQDVSNTGNLNGSGMNFARISILQEATTTDGDILGGMVPVADGNAGSVAGISGFEFSCMQNYYRVNLAAALSRKIYQKTDASVPLATATTDYNYFTTSPDNGFDAFAAGEISLPNARRYDVWINGMKAHYVTGSYPTSEGTYWKIGTNTNTIVSNVDINQLIIIKKGL